MARPRYDNRELKMTCRVYPVRVSRGETVWHWSIDNGGNQISSVAATYELAGLAMFKDLQQESELAFEVFSDAIDKKAARPTVK